MKEIDFNKPFLDDEDQQSGKTLSQMLVKVILNSVATKTPMKLFEMALELKKKSVLKLDSQDKEMLTEFITSHEGMFLLLKGQLLQLLK